MIVSATNAEEAQLRAREFVLRQDPEFELDRFAEDGWEVRPLESSEQVEATNIAGTEGAFSESPYHERQGGQKRISRGSFLRQVGLIGAAAVADGGSARRTEGQEMQDQRTPEDEGLCPVIGRTEAPEVGWRIQDQVLVPEDGAIRVMMGEDSEALYAEAI